MRYHNKRSKSKGSESYDSLSAQIEAAATAAATVNDDTQLDPYTPALIDAIDASPGVVIREGTVTKKSLEEDLSSILGTAGAKELRKRNIIANLDDNTRLKLLGNRELSSSMQRRSILPAIQTQGVQKKLDAV